MIIIAVVRIVLLPPPSSSSSNRTAATTSSPPRLFRGVSDAVESLGGGEEARKPPLPSPRKFWPVGLKKPTRLTLISLELLKADGQKNAGRSNAGLRRATCGPRAANFCCEPLALWLLLLLLLHKHTRGRGEREGPA